MPSNYNKQKLITTDFYFLLCGKLNREIYEDLCLCESYNIAAALGYIPPVGYRIIRTVEKNSITEYALLCDTDKSLAAYITCYDEHDERLMRTLTIQSMHWRSPRAEHALATNGLLSLLFQRGLVDAGLAMCTSGAHTHGGRDFWSRQVSAALSSGRHVYRYDRIANDLTIISSSEVIATNDADIWGCDDRYSDILLIISKEPLVCFA